jgi:hypothetical protein
MSFWKPLTLSEDFANAFSKLEASPTISTLILQARGVYKLDLPCKDADSAASNAPSKPAQRIEPLTRLRAGQLVLKRPLRRSLAAEPAHLQPRRPRPATPYR